MQLRLFNDDRIGTLILKGLNIKNALTGLANRVRSDMVAGININFKTRHKVSIPFSSVIASEPPRGERGNLPANKEFYS
jgi:hypothetical protein